MSWVQEWASTLRIIIRVIVFVIQNKIRLMDSQGCLLGLSGSHGSRLLALTPRYWIFRVIRLHTAVLGVSDVGVSA